MKKFEQLVEAITKNLKPEENDLKKATSALSSEAKKHLKLVNFEKSFNDYVDKNHMKLVDADSARFDILYALGDQIIRGEYGNLGRFDYMPKRAKSASREKEQEAWGVLYRGDDDTAPNSSTIRQLENYVTTYANLVGEREFD